MHCRRDLACRPRAHQYAALRHVLSLAFLLLSPLPALAAATATIGGPFLLTAADGTAVTDRSYRGKWLLVYFGFTSCPNSCPATLLEMAVLLEQLGPDADRLQPLFISVDPERDTPDLIRAYTGAFDPRIVGLSGSPEQIAAAAKAYGAYYVPHRSAADAADYVIDHSSYLYLMAPDGAFVRGFDAATPAADIAAVLRPLMRQTQRPGADRPRR